MSLVDARSHVWELEVRSGRVNVFRTQLGCVYRNVYQLFGHLRLNQVFNIPMEDAMGFSVVRAPAWSIGPRTKCRSFDDMLEEIQNGTAEVHLSPRQLSLIASQPVRTPLPAGSPRAHCKDSRMTLRLRQAIADVGQAHLCAPAT